MAHVTSDPDIDQRDPRWIGAWWLGFVICGICIAIWSLPVLLFPPKIAGANASSAKDGKNLLSNVKGLFFLQRFLVVFGWLGGVVVRALDWRLIGREFYFRPAVPSCNELRQVVHTRLPMQVAAV